MRVGIVGAGIMGRTLCCHLLSKQYEPILFEKNSLFAKNCSFTAAGMLSAYAETSGAMPSLNSIGKLAISFWKKSLVLLPNKIFFDDGGTICIADDQNEAELNHFKKLLSKKFSQQQFQEINIADYEPELQYKYRKGVYLPYEAQLDAAQLMAAFAKHLLQQQQVVNKTVVLDIQAQKIITAKKNHAVDWTIDCRGLGAKKEFKDLRGVRGELVMLHAPTVKINHVIRFFHPRYHIYIVPRPNNHYLIGASCIEVEDYSPITLKTILELLSTAFSVHKGFAEAKLINTSVHCRPAFDENLPRIYIDEQKKIIKVNGLYRYGYLFAPFFALAIEEFFSTGSWSESISSYRHS